MADTAQLHDHDDRWSLPPDIRVALFSALLAGLAVLIHQWGITDLPPLDVPFHVEWWHIAILSLLADLLVVRLESRGETQMLSLGDIPVTIGLALASPIGLLVGRLAGAGFALAVVRRQPLRKLAFNLSLFAFETTLAYWVYRTLLGNADPVDAPSWTAAVVAVLVADAVSVLGVTAVIALYAGAPRGASIPRALALTWLTGLASAGIGLGVIGALWYNPPLAVLFVPVVLGVYVMNRTYLTLSQRYRSLETLHGFTRDLGRSLDIEAVGGSVLRSALDLMRAEAAHLVIHERPEGLALLISAADGVDDVTVRAISPDLAENAFARLSPDMAAHLWEGPDALPPWIDDRAVREVVVAPVEATTNNIGLLLVINAREDIGGFDRRDLTFFETLANHASKAIENSHLYHRLRREAMQRTHQALHDPLTGLPNRQLLDERLEAELAMAREHDTQVGVMVIDLELFKEVNDTLGHHAGDNILRSVCRRLEELMPDDATLVRFGGDEFVVLVPEAESVDALTVHARTLLGAFDQPFIEQDLDIVIGASIGLALYPEHADTAATLLQRADVAMYRAKAARAGFEVYAPELDPFTPRRLALAGQLREAIDRHQVEVVYQPQIDLIDGKVVGVEALVRWRHPTLGLLPPSEFVAAAEQTGAIKPLTLRVLDLALATCKAWRNAGFDLKMSVNLSVTSLLDQSLPDDVRTLLEKHGVPAESLVLELTEGSVMTESRRSVSVLAALDDMGVKLSIDDFGTGYSSMSHLRRLPISEIKIDRSFISDFTINDHDLAIVRTTIDLGHHLGMRVVAEGAEGADALDKLRELGCDLAQGYVISRPRDKVAIDAWLATQDVARLVPPTEPTSLHERRIQRRDHA